MCLSYTSAQAIHLLPHTYELTHSPTHPNHAKFLACVHAIMGGVGFWGDPYIGLRVKC